MATDVEPLTVADQSAWRAWLDDNEESHDGVWLVLAKKGTTSPTSLRYQEALDEALCSGWIDGQKRSFDDAVFLQRFTPRRKASVWSKRNVGIVEELLAEGRMRPRGLEEVDRAKIDGRWERAYDGSRDAKVPDDLAAALAASPIALARFEDLSSTERFAILAPLQTAATDKTRAARLARSMDMLEHG